MGIWEYLVEIHQTQNWQALVLVYGVVVACVLFVCLQLLLMRSRRLALKAVDICRKMMADMQALESQMDEQERRMDGRLDTRIGELETRMTRKMDQKSDLIQERLDRRTADLNDRIVQVEDRMSTAQEDVGRFREQLAEVEARIPGLFDRLDEFRETLGKTFQAEISSVLNSFDNSMTGVLQQMKSELVMGISRIESIESMVRSRHRAERTLLGEPEVPEVVEEDEGKFAEWEEEAKELAATDEDEDEPEAEGLEAIPVTAPPAEAEEYPGEMVDEKEVDAAEEDETSDEFTGDELDDALLREELDAQADEKREEDAAEEDEEL